MQAAEPTLAASTFTGPRAVGSGHCPWTKVPISIRRTADARRMLRQAAQEWRVILLSWAAIAGLVALDGIVATPVRLLAVALLVLLVGGRLHALGVVLHDACHMPHAPGSAHARPDVRLRWLAALAGYPIATTIEAMRFHHLRHHRFSCMAEDPYLKPGTDQGLRWILLRARGLLIVPFWSVRALLGTAITVWAAAGRNPGAALGIYRRVFLQDRGARNPSARTLRETITCARSDLGQAVFIVLALLLTWRWPFGTFIAYWLPVSVAGVFNAHRVAAEHRHALRTDDGLDAMLSMTLTHGRRGGVGGLLSRLLLYPRNIGFHQVHHLYPAAELASLPALDRWWRERASTDATAATDARLSQKRPQSNPPPPIPGCE